MMKEGFVVSTDIGANPDEIIALKYLFELIQQRNDAEIVAIIVSGENLPVKQALLKHVLKAYPFLNERQIPIFMGYGTISLTEARAHPAHSMGYYAAQGLAYRVLPEEVDDTDYCSRMKPCLQLLGDYSGSLTLLSLAPLTDIATLLSDEACAKKIGHIYSQGGVRFTENQISGLGNNWFSDITALEKVLACCVQYQIPIDTLNSSLTDHYHLAITTDEMNVLAGLELTEFGRALLQDLANWQTYVSGSPAAKGMAESIKLADPLTVLMALLQLPTQVVAKTRQVKFTDFKGATAWQTMSYFAQSMDQVATVTLEDHTAVQVGLPNLVMEFTEPQEIKRRLLRLLLKTVLSPEQRTLPALSLEAGLKLSKAFLQELVTCIHEQACVLPQDENPYAFEDKLIQNPYAVYTHLRERMISTTTPFPELQPLVTRLLTALNSDMMRALAVNNPILRSHLDQIILQLKHVGLRAEKNENRDMRSYPYFSAATERYAHGPTVQAIYNAVVFFEAIERGTKDGIPPVYHADRYTYYAQQFPQRSDGIFLPSDRPLSMRDLIKLRSVPVWLIGVTCTTIFADAYNNSPAEFYVHDANHIRRFCGYNDLYFRQHHIDTEEAKLRVYQQFSQTIEEVILPSCALPEDLRGLSRDEVNIRKIMLAFYFEFLHEYSFPPTRDFLIFALRYRVGDPAPYEVFVKNDDFQCEEVRAHIAERRMSNNNLRSGFSNFPSESGGDNLTVLLYHDTQGPNIVTTLYNKLISGFHHFPAELCAELPAAKEREPELLVQAVLRVMSAFNVRASDLQNNPEELWRTLYELAVNEMNQKPLGPVDKYQHKSTLPAYTDQTLKMLFSGQHKKRVREGEPSPSSENTYAK